MVRSRPSFLKLRKIIGPPALRPWFLIYWFLNKEGEVYLVNQIFQYMVSDSYTTPPPPPPCDPDHFSTEKVAHIYGT